MSEFRQNLATKEWVVIPSHGIKRPAEFKAAPRPAPPAKDPECSCCPGHEKLAPPAKHILGDEKKWKVRVFESRMLALIPGAPQPESRQDVYHNLPAEGVHEIIVDSPSHAAHPALLQRRQLADLLEVYRLRFAASSENPKVALTLLFKNHGTGSAIDHPHSQLVGSSVVPSYVRHRMDEAEKYFQSHSACVFCKMIEEERRQGARILADTENFCAFVLYAALSPFHIWILPKRHTAAFNGITPKEIEDFAAVLGEVLRKVDVGLGNPDYNYVIQSAPSDRGTTDAFHWYLTLVVRVSGLAGFELASGIFVNPVIPEEAAKFLNAVAV